MTGTLFPFPSDSYVTLVEKAWVLLWLIFRLVPPLVVVLVVSRSDLQNGAVEIDPEIASKVCSSLNPDALQSSLMSDDP